ncbi:hypothetical protein GCM10022200_15610 [Microbacterium awajiense]|uniref:Uncharacterized protein n=1 Tax=Microbacterium awajiense TaxID=415214 RepID=A0ABP7AID3_9MICO
MQQVTTPRHDAAAEAEPAAPPVADGSTVGAARMAIASVILAFVSITAILFLPPLAAGGVLLFVAVLYLARRAVFSWVGALGILVAVVMFIPVRRYALPIPLPFELEPYRVVLVLLLGATAAALLLDRSRPWRPVAFGWPIGIFAAAMLVSIPINGTALVEQSLGGTAVGAVVNWVLVLSVFYITRQILSTERIVMGLLAGLVWCGTIVALLAIAERVTRVNIFWRLNSFLPLEVIADESEAYRAGGFRSFGSSQHPIALSVMLCLLIAVAIYLAAYGGRPHNPINRRIVYGIAVVILIGGVLSAVSRTAIVVLAMMFLLTLLLRPWLGITLFALGLPALAIGTAVLPKVFDTLIGSFFDFDALIASQYTSAGFRGAGRLADLEPALAQAAAYPFFGTGLGSRIVTGESQNAFILDNQVLGTLLEAGAVGVVGLAAFILAPAIMMLVWAYTSARYQPRYALLALTLVIVSGGYATALFFFDAFGFYQTFFVYLMLLAVGAWLLTASPPALAAEAAGRGRYEMAEPPAQAPALRESA